MVHHFFACEKMPRRSSLQRAEAGIVFKQQYDRQSPHTLPVFFCAAQVSTHPVLTAIHHRPMPPLWRTPERRLFSFFEPQFSNFSLPCGQKSTPPGLNQVHTPTTSFLSKSEKTKRELFLQPCQGLCYSPGLTGNARVFICMRAGLM